MAGDAGGAAASKDVTGLFLIPKQPYDGRPKTMRITMTSSPVATIALCVVLASPAFADTYAAVSNTAMSITGDIELDETGITYENGEQVTFDEQNAEGDMATASSIAQKFANEDLDLILGVATPTSQAVVKVISIA